MSHFLLLLTLFFWASCASVYTGQRMPDTGVEDISSTEESVTFRFVYVYEMYDPMSGKKSWSVKIRKKDNHFFSYLSSLNVFKKTVFVGKENEDVWVHHLESPESFFVEKFSFDTNYLIDVIVRTELNTHGTGTGNLGMLLSGITLGIIPHYMSKNEKIEVNVIPKSEFKKNQVFELEESYGMWSSTLFNLLPSSEVVVIGNRLNRVDKNTYNLILKKIIDKISD